jgi:hypothetical protein
MMITVLSKLTINNSIQEIKEERRSYGGPCVKFLYSKMLIFDWELQLRSKQRQTFHATLEDNS